MIQGARQGEHEDEADTKQGMGVNGQEEIFFCYATWKRALYFLEGLAHYKKGCSIFCGVLAFHSEFIFCISFRVLTSASLYVYFTFVWKSLRCNRVMMEDDGHVVSYRWFHGDMPVYHHNWDVADWVYGS
jgi:hypothetical protein